MGKKKRVGMGMKKGGKPVSKKRGGGMMGAKKKKAK